MNPTIPNRSRHRFVVAFAIGTAMLIQDGHTQDSTFTSDVNVVFRLTDNGRRQAIRYFSRVSDLPLTVALLVETSPGMLIGPSRGGSFLAEEALATGQFFTQVLRPGDDSAELLHFDNVIGVLQAFTSSREELMAALAQLRTPALPGDTGQPRPKPRLHAPLLYDAVRYAAESMPKKREGRKAIILLSDGIGESQTPQKRS